MKTDKTKQHLIAAIQNLPENNALANAKIYLQRALREIESADAKTIKRTETNHQNKIAEEWKRKLGQMAQNPLTAKQTLAFLDKMLENEKKKMIESQKKKESPPNTTLID